MTRYVRRLTDTECRKAAPAARNYKLYDEGNLQLLIRVSGTKVWQYPYKIHGKRNVYTIGQYPRIGIADARKQRDDAKALIEQGIDPNREKANRYTANTAPYVEGAEAVQNSFEIIAREWHSKQVWDEKHTKVVLRSLDLNVFPFIGKLPVDKITARDVLQLLRAMEARGALENARRVAKRIEAVLEYALGLLLVDNNVATGRGKTLKSNKRVHRPHLPAKYIPEFLKALDSYRGSLKVKLAMQLLWLTFVRPGELRNARWEDFDEDKAMWRIPAERMKMRRPHLVPLSRQALDVLKQLRTITGKGDLLFPGERDATKPISDVALIKVLIILGFHKDSYKKAPHKNPFTPEQQKERSFVPHGIRGSASTILNEIGKFKPDYIERQLAHIDSNGVRAAYNHAEYLEERIDMMRWWADYLAGIKCSVS